MSEAPIAWYGGPCGQIGYNEAGGGGGGIASFPGSH